ncbi:CapA family protein [Natronincola ferrireducens]|uniref:Poly-gamma-glutamate synthesis protein (Capsule biosynthesis protein) n=1 Tax=Natronincola ferrireducens TaxID=393762 RepID=A0A1G8ZHH6_9FIRM|nr:CapA family protein [Natronincola ferrireducens]SDK14488.1 poly-gamma-glutamate synthesis protein (capsule biosynthesis protein) [Natronincola ferrireducens]
MIKTIKKYNWLLIIVCLITLLGACSFQGNTTPSYLPENKEEMEATKPEEIIYPPPVEIDIIAVGDIMVHGPQLRAQHKPQDDTYDFTNNFQFVKPYFEKADLVIGNLETTFGGGERGYSSFPMFNTPDTLADALKDSGFHVISTVNNHTMDTGSKGMLRTIDVLKERNLEVIGTRREEKEDVFLIKEIEGIKIGLTAYTYETPKLGEYKTLNGIRVPKEVENLVNSFSYESLEEDLLKMKDTIEDMKKRGVEFIIFYIHWGDEYQRQPNSYQRVIAEKLSDYGVDIIFGSHPHVVQPVEIIESDISNKNTLVVYSMGNFLSNQRYEILKNRYTEDGVIINAKIKKDFEANTVTLQGVSYIPTWVHRYHSKGKVIYEILPVVDALEDKDFYNLYSSDSVWRAENSKTNTIEIIESLDIPRPIEIQLIKAN